MVLIEPQSMPSLRFMPALCLMHTLAIINITCTQVPCCYITNSSRPHQAPILDRWEIEYYSYHLMHLCTIVLNCLSSRLQLVKNRSPSNCYQHYYCSGTLYACCYCQQCLQNKAAPDIMILFPAMQMAAANRT